MNGWQLVTLLAALFNTGAIVYWQRANEARLDAHWERLLELQASLLDWERIREELLADEVPKQ